MVFVGGPGDCSVIWYIDHFNGFPDYSKSGIAIDETICR